MYSKEELQFIRQHLREYASYSEFLKVFNSEFHCNISVSAISTLCSKRLHFTIGSNSGRFSYGGKPRSLPIGTIRTTSTATYIKVANTLSYFSGYCLPDWVPIQRKIWEDANGPVPEGCMICFLDGDNTNLNIDNLCCIDRHVSAILAKHKWWSSDADITRAGIKCAELMIAIQRFK